MTTQPITDNPPTPTIVERLRERSDPHRVHWRGDVGFAVPDALCTEAADLIDELVALAIQYRNDLRYPPAPDSVERRLAAIEAVIAKIQP